MCFTQYLLVFYLAGFNEVPLVLVNRLTLGWVVSQQKVAWATTLGHLLS